MINWKNIVAAILALDKEAFVMHIVYIRAKTSIYPTREASIALLLAKKVSVPKEYANFSDISSKKLVAVLPERSNINKHTIDLEPDKQPPYKLIYSLGLVELETLKT